MWPGIAAVLGPFVGLVGVFLRSERKPRQFKRIERLAEIWAVLPDGSTAKQEFASMIDASAIEVAERARQRVGNPVNKTNVVMTIILTAICLWVESGLWTGSTTEKGTIWGIAATVGLFVWGAGTLIVFAACLTTLRDPPHQKSSPTSTVQA